MVPQSCMISELITVDVLRPLVFTLVLFLDQGRRRGDKGFGVTGLDEGLEGLHFPLGQLDL